MRLAALALIAALAAPQAGAAQTLEQRFERWFGPPLASGPQTSRPAPPARQAQTRAPSPLSVPTPTLRPGEEAATPDAPASSGARAASADEPAPAETADKPDAEAPASSEAAPEASEAAREPAAGPVWEPAAAVDTDGEPAEPEIEIVPLPQERPAEEPGEQSGRAPARQTPEVSSHPDAAATEASQTPEPEAAGPGPSEPPAESETLQPAYVSPDTARTTPEEGAPQTPDTAISPAMSVEAARAVEDAQACETELRARGAIFTVGASLSDGDCGVLRPVAMTRTSSGIDVSPATRMLCRTALAFDIWATESVGPAARAELGAKAPSSIVHASTYVCRERASEVGISEHARGSAIDIGAFRWDGGDGGREPISVEAQTPGSPEDRFLASVRRAACGPFATVIGPGTDPDHADHFHLDIAARANGSTYCR